MNRGPDWITWAIRAGVGILIVWALDRIEVNSNRLTKLETELRVVSQYLFDNPHRQEPLPRGGGWPQP